MKTIKYLSVFIIGVFFSLTLMYANVLADDNTSSAQATISEASDTESTKQAEQIPITIGSSTGSSTARLQDESYNTKVSFSADEALTITGNGQNIRGLYIIWNDPPKEWTLTYNDTSVTQGQHGYLHEYVRIPDGVTECTITFNSASSVCDIYAYSDGQLPEDVQTWDTPCENADILVFSTHADDEILFLGGVLATYAGQQNLRVQVVYMTNYWNGARIREHEKLDGIWHSGVRHYPVNGSFDDVYADSLASAKTVYDYDEVLSFVTEQIRRFKPQICVTQDLNGEYGHGGHQLLASTIEEAVQASMNEDFCPASAATYGTWDIPKTYFHLYPENTIQLNLRTPLSNMDNKTALDIASEAYKLHVSQQWCWFYVSDDYEYSCANFGLVRSTVGSDTQNNMMEHLVSYEEQEKLAKQKAEEESIAASEAESRSAVAASKQTAHFYPTDFSEQKQQKILAIATILFFIALLCVLGFFCAGRLRSRMIENSRLKKEKSKDPEQTKTD